MPDIFAGCREFDKIFVMGPHRAGTRITAKAMAHSLGYEYYDEVDIGCRNLRLALKLADKEEKFVLQSPALSSNCFRLLDRLPSTDDVLIVFCMRDVKDIMTSEQRIGWKGERVERRSYNNTYKEYLDQHPELYDAPISVVIYDVWENVQKAKVPNYVEFEYESLKGHELWVDKNDRKNFKPLQTVVGQKRYEERREI